MLRHYAVAQVTNPPIDPLREGLVMSLNMRLGKRGNLLQPGPGSYNQLLLETPILVESELEAIQTSSGLSNKVLPPYLTTKLHLHQSGSHGTYHLTHCVFGWSLAWQCLRDEV